MLSPQGHVEHHLTLTDDGEAIWAHVEPGTTDALLQFLTSMRFMMRVEAQDVTADYAVLSLLGPEPRPTRARGGGCRAGWTPASAPT